MANKVLIATGYDRDAVQALAHVEVKEGALAALGALPGAERGLYAWAHASKPGGMDSRGAGQDPRGLTAPGSRAGLDLFAVDR